MPEMRTVTLRMPGVTPIRVRSLLPSLAAVALAVAACGSAEPLALRAQPDTPVEQRLVGCTQYKYDRSALQGPTGAEKSDHPAAAVLRKEIEASEGAEMRPTDEWRFLFDNGQRVIFGGGAFEELATHGLTEVHVENEEGEWTTNGARFDCRLEVDTGRDSIVDFALANGTPPPETQALDLLIVDHNCGGKDVLPRLREPLIEYREETVDILLTAAPLPEGFYTCEGFPPTPWTLRLQEATGDRAIRNAAVYPPRPPSPADEL